MDVGAFRHSPFCRSAFSIAVDVLAELTKSGSSASNRMLSSHSDTTDRSGGGGAWLSSDSDIIVGDDDDGDDLSVGVADSVRNVQLIIVYR